MRIDHHLKPATLSAYLAGSLAPSLRLVAAGHIGWCPTCRRALEAARSSDAPEPASHAAVPEGTARPAQTQTKARPEGSPADFESAFDGIDTGLPGPLTALLGGHGLDDLRWRKVLPGVEVHRLPRSTGAGDRACLVRLVPGKALPMHGHAGAELTMVLRGSYGDQLGRYAIGDVSDLDGSAMHRPVAEPEGCICLIAAETPARYSSLLARMWQIFFRF